MKKWTLSAILYVLLVVAGYTLNGFFQVEESSDAQSESGNHGHSEKEQVQEHTEEEGHEGHGVADSEVNVTLDYKEDLLYITLTDNEGNPVSDLEINHEKYMHVIVVNEHLDTYQHIHPNEVGAGNYEVAVELENDNYRVFVDIKPKDLSYTVQPMSIVVGEVTDTHGHGLQPDNDFTQEMDGKKVTLQMSSQTAGEAVTLNFELDATELEPYLGAMGHVVILDEHGEKYLHVHPEDTTKPVFGTQFDQPGIYKIWAEFKQDGKVRVFPFVVEIL
ncbi:hypothetical protein M3175_07130 [Robertmurraya korlensis]|uniref:hypothetical protein n=1 Tax=Robertmurraya korlensis TaxID=519977 RepID=UPI00203D1626|nr:hypothetical protein [Robertmurraya korlensis]MCM3600497.1 hypothetical protein [Robertmurraya korlensis]